MNSNLNITYSQTQIDKKIKKALINADVKDGLNVFNVISQELGGIVCIKCLSIIPAFDIERFHKNGGCCVNCQ